MQVHEKFRKIITQRKFTSCLKFHFASKICTKSLFIWSSFFWHGWQFWNILSWLSVCRRVNPPIYYHKPPIIGYPPILKTLLPPPPPNFQASKPFSNCIQIHHFNLYKTLLWPSDEDYWAVVVLSIRQD